MKFLKHLLAGGSIRLYADGNDPAYRLTGGDLPGMWYAHATLNRAQTTRLDRIVFWLWWNDGGLKQVRQMWRLVKRTVRG